MSKKNIRFIVNGKEYEMLISYNPRFSYFTSEKIINEVKDPHLKDWVEWYKSLYYKGEKNEWCNRFWFFKGAEGGYW